MSIQHYTWSHAGMVRAEPSNGGTFIASEDHAAEVEKLVFHKQQVHKLLIDRSDEVDRLEDKVEKLSAVVKFVARFSCDLSLYGTLPTCSDQYPDQRDTHWCVGCMARETLSQMEPNP